MGSAASTASFYPYGELKSGSATEKYGFATYWRDGETGLDYAVNRYYSSAVGRFLSPDPYGGSMNPKNPQSFNLYAYVQNDPINLYDPAGLQSVTGQGGGIVPVGGGLCVSHRHRRKLASTQIVISLISRLHRSWLRLKKTTHARVSPKRSLRRSWGSECPRARVWHRE